MTTAAMRNKAPEKRKRQHWMTPATLEIIEMRRDLVKRGTLTTENEEKIRLLNRDIQRNCRKDKNQFLSNMCHEIELHAHNNQTKDLFAKIKMVTRSFAPKTCAVRNHNGEEMNDWKDLLNVWR